MVYISVMYFVTPGTTVVCTPKFYNINQGSAIGSTIAKHEDLSTRCGDIVSKLN